MEMTRAGLLGLLSEGGGLSIGILLLYFFRIKNGKIMGMLYGGTSGLMLAMICFDVLPEALNRGRTDLVFCGIGIGMFLGVALDEWVPLLESKLRSKKGLHVEKAGLILVIGIAIHNLPEGFALGTMALAAEEGVLQFALIMALHSMPEGIAMAIPFIKGKTPLSFMLLLGIGLGGIMAIGAMAGCYFSGLYKNMISTSLGVAAGIILYIVCGELIPESRKIWNGRLTTIATIMGLMGGMVLLA